MVGKIATGEIEDEREALSSAAAELGRKGGQKRAENMTPERRQEIARKAAEKRWSK
jgi:general stress protein YciG